jgi:hypothetical protein
MTDYIEKVFNELNRLSKDECGYKISFERLVSLFNTASESYRNYKTKTIKELKNLCKERKLNSYSNKKKDEIALILTSYDEEILDMYENSYDSDDESYCSDNDETYSGDEIDIYNEDSEFFVGYGSI